MGEHGGIRKSVVGNLAGNDCLGSDDMLRVLHFNGYLHSFFADTLIYVQVKAFWHDICRFSSAREEALTNKNLASKGETS